MKSRIFLEKVINACIVRIKIVHEMINHMISNFPFDCGRLINLDQFRGVSSASEADDEKKSDGREYFSLDLVIE